MYETIVKWFDFLINYLYMQEKECSEYIPSIFMNEVPHLKLEIGLNGYPVKAAVDSGVGSSIISSKGARNCKILSLIDKSKSGTCYGAGGKSKIYGKIHLAMIKMNDVLLPCSIYVGKMTIFEKLGVELLIGLDFLSNHDISLNMDKVTLDIGSINKAISFWENASDIHEKIPKFNDVSLIPNLKIDSVEKKKNQYLILESYVKKQIETDDIERNKSLSKTFFQSYDNPHLLFVRCWINGKGLLALIDTGAYTTFISKSAAEYCGIFDHLDRSCASKRLGVGVINLLGKIEGVKLCFDSTLILPIALNCLKELDIDMLLGLNVLATFNISIDIIQKCLYFRKHKKNVRLIELTIER